MKRLNWICGLALGGVLAVAGAFAAQAADFKHYPGFTPDQLDVDVDWTSYGSSTVSINGSTYFEFWGSQNVDVTNSASLGGGLFKYGLTDASGGSPTWEVMVDVNNGLGSALMSEDQIKDKLDDAFSNATPLDVKVRLTADGSVQGHHIYDLD